MYLYTFSLNLECSLLEPVATKSDTEAMPI